MDDYEKRGIVIYNGPRIARLEKRQEPAKTVYRRSCPKAEVKRLPRR